MNPYASLLVPSLVSLVGAVVLAWVTGGWRKYGYHLERLADLAAKMPEDSEARRRLDEAVQDEAARLLRVPARIRRLELLLLFLFWPLVPTLLAWRWRLTGTDPESAFFYGVNATLTLLLFYPVIRILGFHGPRWQAQVQHWWRAHRHSSVTAKEGPPGPPAPRPPGPTAQTEGTFRS